MSMRPECETVSARLSAYIDGELSSAEDSFIKKHLAACEICRTEYENLKENDAALLKLKEIEPSRRFNFNFWEKAENSKKTELNEGWFWRIQIPLAAALTCAILFFFLSFSLKVNALEPRFKSGIVEISKDALKLKSGIINPLALIDFCKKCANHLCRCAKMKSSADMLKCCAKKETNQ